MPKKILVVDDEHVIADSLAAILRNCGYDVAVAYEAQSAIRHCDFAPPDLIISDVVMPGMNGVQMAVVIRERHPDCRILLFSGQTTALDLLQEARQRGYHFDLLSKPVHPKDLLAKIAGGDQHRVRLFHKPPVSAPQHRFDQSQEDERLTG